MSSFGLCHFVSSYVRPCQADLITTNEDQSIWDWPNNTTFNSTVMTLNFISATCAKHH